MKYYCFVYSSIILLHYGVFQAAYTKYLECLRLMSNVLYLDACQYGVDKSCSECKCRWTFGWYMCLSCVCFKDCLFFINVFFMHWVFILLNVYICHAVMRSF